MQQLLFKCFLLTLINFSYLKKEAMHPLFVSVTDIEHNNTEKTVEITCKIFTDDFEKALRAAYKTKIDLIDAKYKTAMDKIVADYVPRHLKITIDGKAVSLKYIGYERVEEAIVSYYEVPNISVVKKINITDDILYEYKKEQISLLHVTINGKRQSSKLSNPEKQVMLTF
jgi:hypothetical protein